VSQMQTRKADVPATGSPSCAGETAVAMLPS
jgi:hypothetical protein